MLDGASLQVKPETSVCTWKKVPEVDGVTVRISLRLFGLVAVEVLALSTPPHVFLVLTGHHQVFTRTPASHQAISVVVAPISLTCTMNILLNKPCLVWFKKVVLFVPVQNYAPLYGHASSGVSRPPKLLACTPCMSKYSFICRRLPAVLERGPKSDTSSI